MIIGNAWSGGCNAAPAEAIVPLSMNGKIGRSQAGVMSWILSLGLVKRRTYYPTARMKEATK